MIGHRSHEPLHLLPRGVVLLHMLPHVAVFSSTPPLGMVLPGPLLQAAARLTYIDTGGSLLNLLHRPLLGCTGVAGSTEVLVQDIPPCAAREEFSSLLASHAILPGTLAPLPQGI